MTVPKTRNLIVLVVLSFLALSTVAQNNAATTEYKAGQVWRYAGDITITVLKVEEQHKHRIVHVRVENVPIPACGGIHLTDTFAHVALTDKMLRKDTADMIKENSDLPDSYFDGYRQWQRVKKPLILDKTSVGDLIRRAATGPGPVICNFLPAETT